VRSLKSIVYDLLRSRGGGTKKGKVKLLILIRTTKREGKERRIKIAQLMGKKEEYLTRSFSVLSILKVRGSKGKGIFFIFLSPFSNASASISKK